MGNSAHIDGKDGEMSQQKIAEVRAAMVTAGYTWDYADQLLDSLNIKDNTQADLNAQAFECLKELVRRSSELERGDDGMMEIWTYQECWDLARSIVEAKGDG